MAVKHILQLKELQEFGLINKKSYEGYPLHVEYGTLKTGWM